MPVMHCIECHHEWESISQKSLCDWCGAGGYVLKSKTDLEKMLEMWKKHPEKRPSNGLPFGYEASYVETPAYRIGNKNE